LITKTLNKKLRQLVILLQLNFKIMIKLTKDELKNVFGGVAMSSCTAKCGTCASITCSGGSGCNATDGESCESYNYNSQTGKYDTVDIAICC
jgi:hypothetical protein